jgi:hypothetical protein
MRIERWPRPTRWMLIIPVYAVCMAQGLGLVYLIRFLEGL